MYGKLLSEIHLLSLCIYALHMHGFHSIFNVNSTMLVRNCTIWERFKLFMAYLLHYNNSK